MLAHYYFMIVIKMPYSYMMVLLTVMRKICQCHTLALYTYCLLQVVLIGDHKQLRPVIKNQVAKDLGMEKSLFERHADNAIMLDTQYRMVSTYIVA